MQQLPPFPEEPMTPPGNPEPDQPMPADPGQPTTAPAESPGLNPNVDVPSPVSPGTQAPTTPISPVS